MLSSVVSHTLSQHVSTGHLDQGRLHCFSRGHSLIFPLDARANAKCNLSPQNHSPKFKYEGKLKIIWGKDNHLTCSWWLGNVYGHTLPHLAAPLPSLTHVASEPFPTGELHITALTAPLQKWRTPFSNAICFSSGPDWHLGPGKRTEMNEKTKQVWCLGTSSYDLANVITPLWDSEMARQAKVSAGCAVSSPCVPQDMHSCAHTIQMINRGNFKIQ